VSLKFTCPTCGIELVIQFLKPGEIARCRNCGADVVVPYDAEQVAWDSSIVIDRRKKELPEDIKAAIALTTEKTPYPNIPQAIRLIVLLTILSVLLAMLVGIIDEALDAKLIDSIIVIPLLTILSFGVVLTWGFKKTNLNFKEVFPLNPVKTVILIPLTITILGMMIILSEIDNLTNMLMPAPQSFTNFFERLFENPWRALLAAIIIAPITEEFLFRGLILKGFVKLYSFKKAIIVSAILFGAMHLNPWQFAGAFFLGLLFAWLAIKTDSLLPCLCGHALANSMPIILIHLTGLHISGFSGDRPIEPVVQPWWFDLLGLVLAGFGIWWLMKIFRKDSDLARINPECLNYYK